MCKRQVGCLGRTRRKKRARTPRRLPRTGITYARRTNKNRSTHRCAGTRDAGTTRNICTRMLNTKVATARYNKQTNKHVRRQETGVGF